MTIACCFQLHRQQLCALSVFTVAVGSPMSLECHRCRRGAGKVQRVKAGLGCYVGGVAIYRGLCEESFVVEKKSEAVGERKNCRSETRAGTES